MKRTTVKTRIQCFRNNMNGLSPDGPGHGFIRRTIKPSLHDLVAKGEIMRILPTLKSLPEGHHVGHACLHVVEIVAVMKPVARVVGKKGDVDALHLRHNNGVL